MVSLITKILSLPSYSLILISALSCGWCSLSVNLTSSDSMNSLIQPFELLFFELSYQKSLIKNRKLKLDLGFKVPKAVRTDPRKKSMTFCFLLDSDAKFLFLCYQFGAFSIYLTFRFDFRM